LAKLSFNAAATAGSRWWVATSQAACPFPSTASPSSPKAPSHSLKTRATAPWPPRRARWRAVVVVVVVVVLVVVNPAAEEEEEVEEKEE